MALRPGLPNESRQTMAKKEKKTNVMRILDKEKISYETKSYDYDEDDSDDEDEDDEPYMIPIDETASEEEFRF